MKRIGIIGGMAPESTHLYYKYIIEEYRRRFNDHSYPEIIIYSVRFQEFIDLMNKDKWGVIAGKLINISNQLKQAGADFVLIATNTMHRVFEKVAGKSQIPLLSIVDAVAREIKRSDIDIVGLLGTKVTMDSNFYKKGLSQYGIDLIVPDEEEKYKIDKIIFDELVKGILLSESKETLLNTVNKLIGKGAEGIILGCTEIPLLIKQEDIDVEVFDSTYIHALNALNYALK